MRMGDAAFRLDAGARADHAIAQSDKCQGFGDGVPKMNWSNPDGSGGGGRVIRGDSSDAT
jgi:hypothetical protein